jgi:pyridoxine kinase
LYTGLKENHLLDYTHLLTGYVGNETFLNKLADIITELKEKNPNIIYLCDPVMGDNGKLYVPESLVKIYIERILPKANIITPNMFELELIYGNKILNLNDMYDALANCHKKGIQTVIVSSSKSFDTSTNESNSNLVLFASSKGIIYR